MLKTYLSIAVSLLLLPAQTYAAEGTPADDVTESATEVPAVVITAEEVDLDPIEGFNRGVYKFNETVDDLFLEPVAKGYRAIVPAPARKKVSNVVSNISEPVSFANSIFQGDVENSLKTFWRFFINSTLGIGGLFDVASEAGLEARKEDFGQTLGKHGAEGGAYIVMPLLGPTNPRDLIGKAVDIFTNPFNYVGTAGTVAINATETVSKREEYIDTIDEINETSFDPYSTIRSAYIQKRTDQINNSAYVQNGETITSSGAKPEQKDELIKKEAE